MANIQSFYHHLWISLIVVVHQAFKIQGAMGKLSPFWIILVTISRMRFLCFKLCRQCSKQESVRYWLWVKPHHYTFHLSRNVEIAHNTVWHSPRMKISEFLCQSEYRAENLKRLGWFHGSSRNHSLYKFLVLDKPGTLHHPLFIVIIITIKCCWQHGFFWLCLYIRPFRTLSRIFKTLKKNKKTPYTSK